MEWDASTFATRSSRPLDSEVRSLAVSQDSKLVAVLTFEGVAVHDVGFASGDGGDPPLSGRSGCGGTELPAGPESSSPHAASRFGRRDDPVQVHTFAALSPELFMERAFASCVCVCVDARCRADGSPQHPTAQQSAPFCRVSSVVG